MNAQRVDPYKGFKFLVLWDGKVVAGIDEVSPLTRRTEVVFHRDGGDPSTSHKSPGRTEYDPITLSRGVTHDLAFELWAHKVWNLGGGLGKEVSLTDFRRTITLNLMNEAGQVVIAYNIYRCWVSKYQALPQLDANSATVAIQSITLENEGWERDANVTEPQEPQV